MTLRKIFQTAAHAGLSALIFTLSAQAAPLNLQEVPLYLVSRADPNVLLNMSVEGPMGGAAYNDNVGTPSGCAGRRNDVLGDATADDVGSCYFPASVYLGYFDPNKCYTYSSGRFNPAGPTSATHTCSASWSGNFLNWASMTAIDMFIWNMTGGNRTTDTTSLTVVRRAQKQDNNSWFPRKVLNSTINVAPSSVTPYANATLYIHNTAWGFNVGTTFASAISATPDIGAFAASLRVCDPAVGLEANCVVYGTAPSTYPKPEGLIQGNAASKRFGVISYSFDNSRTRDGGVLRSNMKYVGPTLPDGSVNAAREFGTDGLLINNPDSAGGGLNSGVINYINKFSDPGYKSFDPVSELFYESVRFFKHLPPTPEYSAGLTAAQCGGFQVLTTWQDPIQYRCQKNFIVAINDAYPWLDKKLPGTFFTSPTIIGAAGFVPFALADGDYGQPSNADPSINVRTLTNTVGALEGLNGTLWSNAGSWTSGTATGLNDGVGGGLGTWDNGCTPKTVSYLGEVMGPCPGPGRQNSYYVAGLAYYANTTDLRTDFGNDRGIQSVNSFVIDTQEFAANPLDGPKNQLWLAGKYGGFVDANSDGIPQTGEWDADGDGVPDNYVLATKPENLISGLNRAFDFINSQNSSAASASVNAGSISSDTRLFQARFNSGEWSGELLAYPVQTDGTLGALDWDASELIPAPGTRAIISVNNNGTAVPFRWTSLDATRQGQLDPAFNPLNPLGSLRLDYLRGVATNEKQNGGVFRDRPISPVRNVLGDIISSSPVFVGKPAFRYPDALETQPYSAFVAARANRTTMVYAGSNDGMLHAFNAVTGVEKLAFIPSPVFKNLHELTSRTYSHRYFVDGAPTMGDAFYGGAWHTMLVGGLNKGGQGVYALDITNPSIFTEANASTVYRWQFTDADGDGNPSNNDVDLGFTYSRPAIVRMRNGKWAAVFGNGYNNTLADGAASTTGRAVLYVVDVQTGNLIRKIDTNAGTGANPNGLATPAVVDIDANSTVDFAYAGDLLGNLWKFNLTSTNPASWDVAYIASGVKQPLFVARDSLGNRQPITSRPEVGRGPKGAGMILLFGTGKYLEPADKDVALLKTQTYYGIVDRNQLTVADLVAGRGLLTQQHIEVEDMFSFTDPGDDAASTADDSTVTVPLRITSKNSVGSTRGWYVDLLSGAPGVPSGPAFRGEMQVSDSILRNGRIIFTTLIPDADPCNFGGTSWLMEMDSLSGARLASTPFDLNNDGEFDNADLVPYMLPDGTTIMVPASGRKSDVGITPTPGILSGEKAEYKYTPGTTGDVQMTVENPGANARGRQSWRQIR